MRDAGYESPSAAAAPAWPSALGATVVLLGVLLAAWHANEAMKFAVAGEPPFAVDARPPPACDADELAEEGLSLAECRQMAIAVHDLDLSSPDWFRPLYIGLAAAGGVLAVLSVFAGLALVDGRRWAPAASIAAFSALGIVDVATFVAVLGTGPLVRQTYLWNILLWTSIHLLLLVASVVCRQAERVHAAPAAAGAFRAVVK